MDIKYALTDQTILFSQRKNLCLYESAYTLKRSSKWPLFIFIFSDLALMILKRILPKYVQLNGLKLNGALDKFSITLQFWGSKMQNTKFEEKKGLSAVFNELKYR